MRDIVIKRLADFSTVYSPKELAAFFDVPAWNFVQMFKERKLIADFSPYKRGRRLTPEGLYESLPLIQQTIMEKYFNKIVYGEKVTWFKYLTAQDVTIPHNNGNKKPISFSKQISPNKITLIELNKDKARREYWLENHFDGSAELFCPDLEQVILLERHELEKAPTIRHMGDKIIACPCGSVKHFYVLREE